MSSNRNDQEKQILGRVKRDQFVGRDAELEKLLSHATGLRDEVETTRGLVILATPFAGTSELLRQGFDSLFTNDLDCFPIYFELPPPDTTVVSAAIEFLNTWLQQYIAYRRREPALCHASLTLNDLRELAPSTDRDWIEDLIDAYDQHRFDEDDRELVRFCLNTIRRVPGDLRPFVMFNAEALSQYHENETRFAREVVRALAATGSPFVIAGLRRELLPTLQRAKREIPSFALMKLEALEVGDSRNLIRSVALHSRVAVNDETVELLAQQLEGSPYFITTLINAARDRRVALDSYFACGRLFVDEIMGGELYRQFSAVLERIAPEPGTRAALVQLLCEALPEGKRSVPAQGWRRRLELDGGGTEKLLGLLHSHEIVNRDGETITLDGGSNVWKDYLRSRFRLDALREPRALVVADLMAGALKRAPQTVARYYRRAASLTLLELLNRFDLQLVPRKLFQYDEFAPLYKGAAPANMAAGLEADADQFRLPQVFHAANGVSFSTTLRKFGEENVVVAHAFEGATYTDRDEVVWLAARVESKLEADASLVEKWLGRLEDVARQSGFVNTRIWLIANEGFTSEASALLREREAFGSSRQQFELLNSRLSAGREGYAPVGGADEFVLVLPMGADNELLAATTAEQIARRLKFTSAAINQIKTAVVEACINAAEHSLSPDRKIYLRFRVENDRLLITVSSRGVLPEISTDTEEATVSRRGWGLKLISTLMDEVEFERVDEGTSLRMTKYLRRTPAAGRHDR